jgi:hypothetical protein
MKRTITSLLIGALLPLSAAAAVTLPAKSAEAQYGYRPLPPYVVARYRPYYYRGDRYYYYNGGYYRWTPNGYQYYNYAPSREFCGYVTDVYGDTAYQCRTY